MAQEIRDAGGQAQVFLADIADAEAVKAMVDSVIKHFGGIDMLVLNASVRKEVRFTEMSFEEWRTVMSISLDGSFHCIKACLPSMIKAGGGNIITLAGDTALSGAVGKVHSSAAKSGLAGMTRALARELAQHGIRVNCVSPGHINTIRPAHRSPRRDPRQPHPARTPRRAGGNRRDRPLSLRPRRGLHHRPDHTRQRRHDHAWLMVENR